MTSSSKGPIVNRNNNKEHETEQLCRSTFSLETELNLERKRCHFPFKTQVKEILNPLQLKRMLEQVFREEKNDDKALSNDDCCFREEPIAFMCDIEGMFHQVMAYYSCYLRISTTKDYVFANFGRVALIFEQT